MDRRAKVKCMYLPSESGDLHLSRPQMYLCQLKCTVCCRIRHSLLGMDLDNRDDALFMNR